jgi:hypothetical protein
MEIRLIDTGDRLGGLLSTHIAGILYAHFHNIPVLYDPSRYDDSVFMKVLYNWISNHNKNAVKKDVKLVSERDWYLTTIHTLKTIQCDYISYFHQHLYTHLRPMLNKYVDEKGYQLPFNPSKTILVHLRLNDIRHLPDYDGGICNDRIINAVNSCRYEECVTMCPDRQAPIGIEKLNKLIHTASKEFPDYDVILLTSPGESISLPYRVISNQDESLDMYLLCRASVVILSRSTFSLVTLMFGDATHVYTPRWCHSACLGLGTKYDNTISTHRIINYYS